MDGVVMLIAYVQGLRKGVVFHRLVGLYASTQLVHWCLQTFNFTTSAVNFAERTDKSNCRRVMACETL
eukprot:scaffold615150_cov19-Prasinocladus_malaysianus.AAC.1